MAGLPYRSHWTIPWWRHQMETFSVLLALCAGNSPVTGEFPTQRPVTRSFDVSLICVWTNRWVNNRGAGNLRRYRAHYDVTGFGPGFLTTDCHSYLILRLMWGIHPVSLPNCNCPQFRSFVNVTDLVPFFSLYYLIGHVETVWPDVKTHYLRPPLRDLK